MSILEKKYVVEMPNGELWAVPVLVIATDRAKYYSASKFGGDVERSLQEDTAPLFEGDDYEIEDWAKNNMDWADVEDFAEELTGAKVDYQQGWINGEIKVL